MVAMVHSLTDKGVFREYGELWKKFCEYFFITSSTSHCFKKLTSSSISKETMIMHFVIRLRTRSIFFSSAYLSKSNFSNFFEFQFGKTIKFFRVQADLTKMLSVLVHCWCSLLIASKKTKLFRLSSIDCTLAVGKNAVSIYTA